jgi:putative endonuclease
MSASTRETYVGQTEDLCRRIKEHNDPENQRTLHTKRRRGPWVIVYWDSHDSRGEAMKRERFLKTGRGRDWIKDHAAEWLENPPSLP